MGSPLRSLVLLALLLAAVLPASAAASLKLGVAEDAPKGMDDGGAAMFQQMRGVGMSVIRISVFWDPAQPETIKERAALDRTIPQARAKGVQVILSIVPIRGDAVTSTPNGYELFAQFAVRVAQSYPHVRDFIIGNEPNQPRFWRPQYDASGRHVAAATYLYALIRARDSLKSYDPTINVIGVGLSPRGNDDAKAASNQSTSPVMFIHDLGVAYRAAARNAPFLDNVNFHPYPNPSSADDPPAKGLQWPNAGAPNLDRLQQAWWDAFHGTAQPLFQENGARAVASAKGGSFVKWVFDESGWQTYTSNLAAYSGSENTTTVTEETQAQFYAELIGRYSCDPRVDSLLFFHWIDEADRDRLQTGLVRADGTAKPAQATVRSAFQAGCATGPVQWSHTMQVLGASASWTSSPAGAFTVRAEEDFTWTASVVSLLKGGAKGWGTPVASVRGIGNAYWAVPVKFKGLTLKKGRYQYTVTLRSTMNPERTTLLNGKPFTR
jgi:hypothetical protein